MVRSAVPVGFTQDKRSDIVPDIVLPLRRPFSTPSPCTREQLVIGFNWTLCVRVSVPVVDIVPFTVPDCAQLAVVPPASVKLPENALPLCCVTITVSLHTFDAEPTPNTETTMVDVPDHEATIFGYVGPEGCVGESPVHPETTNAKATHKAAEYRRIKALQNRYSAGYHG